MSGEVNTILCIVCLLVLVVPMGFWMWKLWKSASSRGAEPVRALSASLVWGFGAFAVALLCDGIHVLNVCVVETVGWSQLMSLLTVSVLFYLPVLVLMQQTIVEARPANGLSIALMLFPSVLYTTFVTYIRIFYGLDHILATPWMHQVEVVGYYYIEFLNIIVGLFLIIWRYRQYHYRACNYFPNSSKSDDSAVRGITFIAILVGAVVYFFQLVSVETLHHNWPATAVVIGIIFFIVNYLGHALCSVKGRAIPADFDKSAKMLTVEEITSLEERYNHADELMSADNAIKNIADIIEAWASKSNPSYLRAGITLTEAAYEMKIPANILSGYINKTLNTNFNQWINAYRLKHVKFLLLTTGMTLDEIAEASGFATRNLLSRTFKTHEGITPSEFRARNK